MPQTSADPFEALGEPIVPTGTPSALAPPAPGGNVPVSGASGGAPNIEDLGDPVAPSEDPKNYPKTIQPYLPIIQAAAEQYGVPVKLVAGVIQAESAGDPKAVSHAGAQGLMQIMPGTAKDLGLDNPFDPKANILAGTKYLSQLYAKNQGDWQETLRQYNAGPNAGFLEEQNPETQSYPTRVLAAYTKFGGDPTALGWDRGGIGEEFANGMLLGQLSKVEGGLNVLGSLPARALGAIGIGDGDPNSISQDYTQGATMAQQGLDAYSNAHPTAAALAQGAGSMVPATAVGGVVNPLLRAIPGIGGMLVGDAIANKTATTVAGKFENALKNVMQRTAGGATQGAIGAAVTSPLNQPNPQGTGASTGDQISNGAVAGAGMSALLGPLAGAGVNAVKGALLHTGNLTGAEAALAQRAMAHGIPLSTTNILGHAEATPEQKQSFTAMLARQLGFGNLKAIPPAEYIAALNAKGQAVSDAAVKVPLVPDQKLNQEISDIYAGKLKDSAGNPMNISDVPAVRRSPGRERVLNVDNIIGQSADELKQLLGQRVVPGGIVANMMARGSNATSGGIIGRMLDSKVPEVRQLGDQLQSAITDAQLRSGADPADLAALTQAKTQYRMTKTLGQALGHDTVNNTVDPKAFLNAYNQDTTPEERARFMPEFREPAQIAEHFLTGTKAKTNQHPIRNDLGIAALGEFLGHSLGGPVGGAAGASIGLGKAAYDIAKPRLMETNALRNALLAHAQGLTHTNVPFGSGKQPNKLAAMAGAAFGQGSQKQQ